MSPSCLCGVIQVSASRDINAIYTMILVMSTVASQVACKHGVDVSRDYLLMDALVKISRDLLCTQLKSERLIPMRIVYPFVLIVLHEIV